MTQKFYAIVTNLGAAKIANAVSLGTKLSITQMAVGDGGGTLPTPNASQTKLVNEVRRAALNSLTVDENNSSQIIAEQVIPETEGGFWIREMGLFDADGTLIAVCNTAETYKPQLQEGSGRTQRLRMMIIVSSTDAVTLKVDPSVVLATRQYVDNAVVEVKDYADGVMEKHVKSANPHTQYPLISNALKELADAGLLPDVLKNLGLGEGAPVIGSPFPWPHTKMPNELFPSMAGMVFLKSNGATFSGALYPKLALAYPGLKLADLRGEFIRGWDDGRAVDASRALLSTQADAIRNIVGQTGFVLTSSNTTGAGAITMVNQNYYPVSNSTPVGSVNDNGSTVTVYREKVASFDASKSVPTANENRPRNVAFNYIVRAA